MRKFKNIVMVVLVIFLLGSSYFTINYAKNHLNNNFMMEDMGGGNKPEMSNNGEIPEKPDGESFEGQDGDAPEKPDGDDFEGQNNEAPEKPNGESPNNNGNMEQNEMISESPNSTYIYYILFGVENILLTTIVIYLIMSKFNRKSFKETLTNSDKIMILVLSVIVLSASLTYVDYYVVQNIQDTNEMPENMENSTNTTSYSAKFSLTEDTTLTSGEYESTEEDENALLVSGDIEVSLSNINVDKTGDSDGGDNTSFYGINSAIIAKNGANLILKNITVTTNATGANGVFSYGGSATTNNDSSDGTTITISDSKITTTKDNSGGIMTTGGGITKATNLTVKTAGISSAAIRTDRGGGTVTVDKGSYTTTGAGSPTIYSTANVSVTNATLTSKTAEGIVIEGKNSVLIDSCELTDSNTKLNGQSTTYKNIFLYQSMSGDAADGSSVFTAKNSKIITNNGDTFYVTNTTANINLENNTIVNNDSTGNFLRVQKDSWGNSGSNGGDVTLALTNQSATGNIVIDSISTLSMNMKKSSSYEGIINGDNSAKEIKLTLDKTSTIKLTGDSYITSLDNKDTTNSNIDFNGYKLYVNGESIN
jgi:hypothetical protein